MEKEKENSDIKEYAGGWITERKGTDVPMFLKIAFVIIAGSCLAYLVVYMNGETTHSERGVFVRAFNAVTQSSNGFMYAVIAIALVYAAILIVFAFKKFHEE